METNITCPASGLKTGCMTVTQITNYHLYLSSSQHRTCYSRILSVREDWSTDHLAQLFLLADDDVMLTYIFSRQLVS